MAPPIKRRKITYATKLEIVQEVERGGKKAHIARKHGVNESTIRTIYRDREKIRKVLKGNPGQATMHAFKVANPVLKTTEKLIGRYIARQNRNAVPIGGGGWQREGGATHQIIRKQGTVLYTNGRFHTYVM